MALLMAQDVASRTSGVLFCLAGITKTQRVGLPPKEHFFGAFSVVVSRPLQIPYPVLVPKVAVLGGGSPVVVACMPASDGSP